MKTLKKLMAILLTIAFAAYPIPSFADGIALTDEEMDQIAAGEWVLAKAPKKTNKLEINEESQSDLTGVSNANTVDSAVASQHNVANAVDGVVDVNQSNQANVTNAAAPANTNSSKTTIESVTDIDETTTTELKDVATYDSKRQRIRAQRKTT